MGPILNVVIPVFAVVAAGYLCGRRGILGEGSSEALNAFVYWVALPALLFRAMAGVEIAEVLDWPLIFGFGGSIVLLWAITLPLAMFVFRRTLAESALHGMNGVYGNTGYMGIPLALAAFGEAAMLPSIVATIVNVIFVVGVSVTLIEFGLNSGSRPSVVIGKVVRSLVQNPMLIAPLAGLFWAATGLDLPTPVAKVAELLGDAAGPSALFAIGLFLVGRPLRQGLGEVAVMTATKLLVMPVLAFVLLAWVWPASEMSLKVGVLMATLPTGAGSFVLAQAYGVYVQRTSSVILISTVVSLVTVSAFFLIFPPS